MSDVPELCLGTVQFGLAYGATNQQGQVPEPEVRRILQLAASSGIDLLDTATVLLSMFWGAVGLAPPSSSDQQAFPGESPSSWEASFISSLKHLQASKLDAFLLHRASDLLSDRGAVLESLLWGLIVLVFPFMRPLT